MKIILILVILINFTTTLTYSQSRWYFYENDKKTANNIRFFPKGHMIIEMDYTIQSSLYSKDGRILYIEYYGDEYEKYKINNIIKYRKSKIKELYYIVTPTTYSNFMGKYLFKISKIKKERLSLLENNIKLKTELNKINGKSLHYKKE